MSTTEDWIADGERRALREWQDEHREPCDDCQWREIRDMCDAEPRYYVARHCTRHGGIEPKETP